MKIGTLVHGTKGYIVRIYTPGWVPLDAFIEDVREYFGEICRGAGDDADKCYLRGDAQWRSLRLTESGRAIVGGDMEEVAEQYKVTMIRVHRKRGRNALDKRR